MHRPPESVQELIENGKIPSPPEVLLRLMRTVDDEQATMAVIAGIVGQDPGLVGRLLQVANSPALRRGKAFETIESCLATLGTRFVRSLATCLSVQRLFTKDSDLSAPELANFWSHSLLVGEMARGIADFTGFQDSEDAYLSGLLHEIGEPVLIQAFGNRYRRFLEKAQANTELYSEEFNLFETTHTLIGGWLIDHWGLRSEIADGVIFHHTTAMQIREATALPQIVWMAKALTEQDHADLDTAHALGGMRFRITRQDLASISEKAIQRTLQIIEAMEMARPPDFPKRSRNSSPSEIKTFSNPAENHLLKIIGGMALLQPLQQNLAEIGTQQELLLALRDSAKILFDFSEVALLLANKDETLLDGKHLENPSPFFDALTIPLHESHSLAAEAVTSRKVTSVFDRKAPPSLLDLQLARALSADGVLCIPMLGGQQAMGVMLCGLSFQRHSHWKEHLEWLANFGKIAAASLENRLTAEQQRQDFEETLAQKFHQHARQIVHEAGNPLGIIKGYLKILERKLPDASAQQEITILSDEIDRVGNIVSHMTSAIRQGPAQKTSDLAGILNDFILLYADILFSSKNILFESHLPSTAIPVEVNRDNLKQIILNLWKNASEALGPGKAVQVQLGERPILQNGTPYFELLIEDNGPGIPTEKTQYLYQPKPLNDTGQRGIGLSVVGDLARRENILIHCESRSGTGTRIQLFIPQAGNTTKALA